MTRTDYPYTDGDAIVLGPEIYASLDGEVINWRGRNYTPQTGLPTQRHIPARERQTKAPNLSVDLPKVIDGGSIIDVEITGREDETRGSTEADLLRAGISYARGMCTDGEPHEKIDAYLGSLS